MKKTLISLISGFLGAFAGADNTSKTWRRIVIPLNLTIYSFVNLHDWMCVFLLGLIGVFSIGYGIPDRYMRTPGLWVYDGGSTLGKFWLKICNEDLFWTNVFTRGSIGLLVCLTILPIGHYNWFFYILGSLAIMLIYSFLSWKDLGGFYFNTKRLLWVEFITYGVIGLVVGLIV